MSKFVCESCQNQSDMPGVCQTPGCAMNGQPLKEMPEENMEIDNLTVPTEGTIQTPESGSDELEDEVDSGDGEDAN